MAAPLQTLYGSTITDSLWQHHYRLYMAAPLQTLYGTIITDSKWYNEDIQCNSPITNCVVAPLTTRYGSTITDLVWENENSIDLTDSV